MSPTRPSKEHAPVQQTNKDWFKGNSSTRDMHLPRRNLGDRNGQSCCPGPVCPESPARWPEGGGQGRKQRFDPDEGLGKDSYRWFCGIPYPVMH